MKIETDDEALFRTLEERTHRRCANARTRSAMDQLAAGKVPHQNTRQLVKGVRRALRSGTLRLVDVETLEEAA